MTDGTPNPDGLADRPQQEAAEGLIDEGLEPQTEAPAGEGDAEAGARVRVKPPWDAVGAKHQRINWLIRRGFRHEPYAPVAPKLAVHRTHPSKPVWWERVKGEDGKWTATPHYGWLILVGRGKRR